MTEELIRTPSLKIVKEIKKVEMSNTTLTNECIAIDCSL